MVLRDCPGILEKSLAPTRDQVQIIQHGTLIPTVAMRSLLLIHSFSSLSYDRSKASSKTSSPHSAIQSFLFQMRVSSPFLKVIQ